MPSSRVIEVVNTMVKVVVPDSCGKMRGHEAMSIGMDGVAIGACLFL